jgi:hypothetical protein
MTDTYLPNSIDAPLVDPEFIANKHKDAFVAATDILRAAQDWPTEVAGPADLETLTAGVRAIMGAAKTLDAARDGEKRRFDSAAKEVQGLFKPRLEKLDAAKAAALATITRYNRQIEEQQRRLAAEAAERERAEAKRRADAAAALETQGHADVAETVMETAVDAERMAEKLDRQATGSAADLVRTHTAGGTVTSATSMTFEVESHITLRGSLGTLGDYIDQPSIDKAIRAYMKAAKLAGREPSLAGVRFFAESKARVR